MSNDTSYSLEFRHREKARLKEVHKGEDGPRPFQDSLKARDVPGLLASAFLGADFDAEATKMSKAGRAWLKRQEFWKERGN